MRQNSKAEERAGFGQSRCAGINGLIKAIFLGFVLVSILGGQNLAAQEIFQGEVPPTMTIFTPPLETEGEALGPKCEEYEDVFPVKLGKIDYLGADDSATVYPPLTQQDYIQVTIPNIYISKYQRGWWGATLRNDIYFTLSIDNGDGVLKVYKYDIVPKQMAARFVPVFNAIVLPVEILRGNHLTIKVEGYTVYEKDKAALQSSSDKLLAAATPLMAPQYAAPVGLALSTFNSVLALKSNDKIFDFTITFDVLTNQGAIDTYRDNVKHYKQAPQLLLRPRKYPVINTNENFPLTLNQQELVKVCPEAELADRKTHLWQDYQNSKACKAQCEETVKLKGDILTISCNGTNYEPVIDHNYMVIQITPWYRDFSNENFHQNINKIRCNIGRLGKDEAFSLIDESRVLLLNSNSYNYLTKITFSSLFRALKNQYEIREMDDKKSDICATGKEQGEECAKFKRKLLETVISTGLLMYGDDQTSAASGNQPEQPATKLRDSGPTMEGDELQVVVCIADTVYSKKYGAMTKDPEGIREAFSYHKKRVILGDYSQSMILDVYDYAKSILNTSPEIFSQVEWAEIQNCMSKGAKARGMTDGPSP